MYEFYLTINTVITGHSIIYIIYNILVYMLQYYSITIINSVLFIFLYFVSGCINVTPHGTFIQRVVSSLVSLWPLFPASVLVTVRRNGLPPADEGPIDWGPAVISELNNHWHSSRPLERVVEQKQLISIFFFSLFYFFWSKLNFLLGNSPRRAESVEHHPPAHHPCGFH